MRVRPKRQKIALIVGALIRRDARYAPQQDAAGPRHRLLLIRFTPAQSRSRKTFRGREFILGESNTVAMVRPLGSGNNAWMKLPFWFGVNILVPGVTQPKEGDYYVISEATLGKPLRLPANG